MPTPFDLNLRHLRALDLIVDLGSMSAAAQAVNLTQPALTQGLAKLERQLGRPLFDRNPDGVLPTEAGLLIAGRARAAFAHLGSAARAALRGGSRGFARPEQLMTATQLRAYLALADAGSFVGAATATGLSQPALHRAVRDLEQIGGVVLVERRGRGVQLTEAGRRLARGVRLAIGEIGAVIAELDDDEQGGGIIRIGAMPMARARVLPSAIAAFQRGAPRATVDIVEGSWRELVEPLHDGVLDMMIGALRDEPPPGLMQTPLFEDRLVVVGRAGHPLAGGAPTVDQLAKFGWIIGRAGTPLMAHWQKLFGTTAAPLAPIECGSVLVIRGVLAESDLLTLLSPDQVALEIATGILTTIGQPLPHGVRTIGITSRADWRPTRAQRRLIDLLETAAQDKNSGKLMLAPQ